MKIRSMTYGDDAFDGRHDDGQTAPVWTGQQPGTPDNDGPTAAGNTAADQRH